MADLIYALYLVGGYAVWLEVLHVFFFCFFRLAQNLVTTSI